MLTYRIDVETALQTQPRGAKLRRRLGRRSLDPGTLIGDLGRWIDGHGVGLDVDNVRVNRSKGLIPPRKQTSLISEIWALITAPKMYFFGIIEQERAFFNVHTIFDSSRRFTICVLDTKTAKIHGKKTRFWANPGRETTMYYHFEYTSGSNPYVAKTDKERDRIIRKHEAAGETVTEIKPGFYIINDQRKEGETMNHIKVNLPSTEQDYISGNGEGVFVIVSDEVKAAHDSDENGSSYTGILDNDSLYYIGLDHGTTVPFEMRGEFRPVVPFSWLTEHYEINHGFFDR